MRRMLGCLLIVSCGLGIGLRRAAALRRRTFALRDFLTTVALLRTEVCCSARPLREILPKLTGSHLCTLASALLADSKSPIDALQTAANRHFQHREDLAMVTDFLQGLGCSDVENQLRHFDRFTEQAKIHLLNAEKECAEKGKLSVCLGVCSALAVCILFG